MTNYRKPAANFGKLRLFHNGFDYVIAENPSGAAALIAIHFGEQTPESKRGDNLSLWTEVPLWEDLGLQMLEGTLVRFSTSVASTIVQRVSYWIEKFGIGYLASSQE